MQISFRTISDGIRIVRTVTVTLKNKLGLHARPASHLVRVASKYKDTAIEIVHGAEVVNGKSILGVMMLAAGNGAELEFRVDGPQEEELLQELVRLVEEKFYED